MAEWILMLLYSKSGVTLAQEHIVRLFQAVTAFYNLAYFENDNWFPDLIHERSTKPELLYSIMENLGNGDKWYHWKDLQCKKES